MLTVACVNHGDYLGRGDHYVSVMQSMVARNLDQPYEFVCLKDVGDESGWWAKLELFRPGRFKGRVLYIDLDCVIVRSLDELVQTKGIIDLRDWGWMSHTLCSSTMVWDAGEHEDIFEEFIPEVKELYRGDQDWITYLGGWDTLPADICRSYRYHALHRPPQGCSIVAMHGTPKPHEIVHGWVKDWWR